MRKRLKVGDEVDLRGMITSVYPKGAYVQLRDADVNTGVEGEVWVTSGVLRQLKPIRKSRKEPR